MARSEWYREIAGAIQPAWYLVVLRLSCALSAAPVYASCTCLFLQVVGEVLINDTSSLVTFSVYSAVISIAIGAAAMLPFDTLGRNADGHARENSPLKSVA